MSLGSGIDTSLYRSYSAKLRHSIMQSWSCIIRCNGQAHHSHVFDHVLHPKPTSELLLPVHLVEEVLCPQEEVVDLAALLVSLCGVVDSQL